MDIGIIGAGNVGKALGASSVRAGHSVFMTAKDLEHACQGAEAVGGAALGSDREVAERSQLILLAVPYTAIDEVLEQVGDAVDGKVLVDVTNPPTWDYSDMALSGTSAAEQIQARAPRARVVKAFNTILASRQADPVVDGIPVDALVAADDEGAKADVMELARSIGMRPVDAGPLRMALALEYLAFLNISIQMRSGGAWQSAWMLLEPGAAQRRQAA